MSPIQRAPDQNKTDHKSITMNFRTILLWSHLLHSVCAATKTIASSSSASSFDKDAKYQLSSTSPGIISTVAGVAGMVVSFEDPASEGVPAISKKLSLPNGITLDKENNLFIACTGYNKIYKVTASSGIITTVAGTLSGGFSGDGGQATSAMLFFPQGVALDSTGNIFIADTGNNRIRKVTVSTGVITTVAGDGKIIVAIKDNVPATTSIAEPTDLTVDTSGNIFFVDNRNQLIRKITASTGMITTFAGSGTNGDRQEASAIATKYRLEGPRGVSLDASGNVFIADTSLECILKVTVSTGLISIVAGMKKAEGYNGDNILATAAKLSTPQKVAFDASGNMYIPDVFNQRIRKVTASTGIITTVAGTGESVLESPPVDGVSATATSISAGDVAFDSVGNLYISMGSLVLNVVKKVTYSDASPSASVTPAPAVTLAPSSSVASTPTTASTPSSSSSAPAPAAVVRPSTSDSMAPGPSITNPSKAPTTPPSSGSQSSSTTHIVQAFHLTMILIISMLILHLCRDA